MIVLADLLASTGRFEEALDVAREAKGILLENVPEDHWRVAAAKNVEGHALAGLGRFEEAEALMLASIEGLRQSPMPGLAEEGRRRMRQLYLEWGRPEEAAKFASN
jgi:hypothetical protein